MQLPNPGRAKRVQFLLDRDGRYVVRSGAFADMPLEVGMGKACDWETLGESAGQVGKVDFGRVESVGFNLPRCRWS